nr:unnamed protein product [Digitaria exilis]
MAGTPSPATGPTPSSAVFDAEAAGAAVGKALPLTADAGAAFVLESKGTWWHAGFHLTTAIVGPTVLTLPYALRGMGWGLGLAALTVIFSVTFYAYFLVSRVLDHCEARGRRHIRFRELAADIMYSNLSPNGPLKLYHFIIIVAVVLAFLSQLPSFHSLRHINFGSLILSFGYTILVSAACIRAGVSSNARPKDYSLSLSKSEKTFNAFLSISILASVFGNGILPEIQATLAPPAAGKMMKALVLCYTVIFFTFYFPAIIGYWAFGNQVQSNLLKSLMPDEGPALAPTWLLGLSVVLVLLQLFAIALVYSQVAYEIMEKNSADVAHGRFSRRNLVPRVALRTAYVAACAFVAAMLPFFGDIVGVVGAVGFIPLDFVLPVVMYNIALAPPRRSPVYLVNVAIMVVFIGVGVIGAVASVRKLVLDASKFKLFSDSVVD